LAGACRVCGARMAFAVLSNEQHEPFSALDKWGLVVKEPIPKGGKRFLGGHLGRFALLSQLRLCFFSHNSCHLSPHRPFVECSPSCIVALFVCLDTGSDNGVGGRILETYGNPALVGQPDPQVYGHVSDIDWKLSTCSTAVRSQFAKVRMVVHHFTLAPGRRRGHTGGAAARCRPFDRVAGRH
jgi:hypothetical protein